MPARAKLPPFQHLLDEHAEAVLGFLTASVGAADAEDCFQETMLAALRAYDGLTDARNLRGWLITIAHRKAIDHHRDRARRPAASAELPERRSPDVPEPRLNGSSDVWRLVGSLPPKQRSALALRFAADMAYRQIGTALDCSEAAARRSVHEGLSKLREELA